MEDETQVTPVETEVQPPAPQGSPATAAPATDQVTVNTHLRKVASEAKALVTYVENFLGDHEVAKKVVESLADVISVVEQSVV